MQRRIPVVGVPPGIEVVIGPAGVVNDQCARRCGFLPIYRWVVVLVVLLEDQFAVASYQERIDVPIASVLDILMNRLQWLFR